MIGFYNIFWVLRTTSLDSVAIHLKFLDYENKNETYEDGGRFLKPNKYFESQLNIDKIRVLPEHVQYDAQYMM